MLIVLGFHKRSHLLICSSQFSVFFSGSARSHRGRNHYLGRNFLPPGPFSQQGVHWCHCLKIAHNSLNSWIWWIAALSLMLQMVLEMSHVKIIKTYIDSLSLFSAVDISCSKQKLALSWKRSFQPLFKNTMQQWAERTSCWAMTCSSSAESPPSLRTLSPLLAGLTPRAATIMLRI